MKERVFLASPHMSDEGYEMQYIKEAFDKNWIAPLGENVDKFEEELGKYVNISHAIALTSGTAGIHMALKALNVGKDDYVFCSSFTFAASANPILYQEAIPVFIDSENDSWNMSPNALKKAFEKYPNPKAVIVVHLYGTPANMGELKSICDEHNVPIVEDAAESLGAKFKDKNTGTIGEYGIYSFNGNKIITTSGGGMIVSNDEHKIEKIKFWITQSRDPAKFYQHSEIGYNYRLSNVLAGIGRGQLKVLDKRIAKKKEIYERYRDGLKDIKEIAMQPFIKDTEPNYWLSAFILDYNSKVKPDDIIEALSNENVEARRLWNPMHLQPIFAHYDYFQDSIDVCKDLFERGICLPSDTKMTNEIQDEIIEIIKKCFKG